MTDPMANSTAVASKAPVRTLRAEKAEEPGKERPKAERASASLLGRSTDWLRAKQAS
jgi:hypothetical protein